MKKKYTLHGGKHGAALAVRVFPRAQHDEIIEISKDGAIKVMLASPGRAAEVNRRLIDFLAGVLSVKKSQIEIVAGERGKKKLISIVDINPQSVHERIVNHLS